MNRNQNIRILKALSEETRYKIVKLLLKRDRCACEIPSLIGRKQANTSMQLSKLVDLGILRYRKEGKCIIYSIKDKRAKKILKILEG